MVLPGSVFDKKDAEDAYGGESSAVQSTPVLCTTSLGLERRIRKDDGTVERTVLAKPKVALESVVEILGVFTDETGEDDGSPVDRGPGGGKRANGDTGDAVPS
ncbi:hypothetical protein OF83DRAFT_1178465 [Amylostereum chailletii]|nr:hypothetical protein OF83DRAFT_1178465 [Amylostereum chailletii]